MPELKPCPFCGGKAVVYESEKDKRYTVRCAEEKGWCETIPETWRYSTVENAIEAWNKRAGE